MNFSISGGIGLFGGLVVFGLAMIAFTIAAAFVARLVKGRDDRPAQYETRSPEDDYIL